MVTKRAEIANLVTAVQGADTGKKPDLSLTESFQSYIAGNNDTFRENTDSMVQQSINTSSEYNQKDAYDKISTGTYSKNVDQVKEQMNQLDSLSKQDADAEADCFNETAEEVETLIRDVIKSNMDMTDEEIDEVLAVMNISIFQLLQPDVLQEFLMTETGTEPIDMLTNGDLIDILQIMNQGMESILEDIDETDVQQLIAELTENEVQTMETMSSQDSTVVLEQNPVELADDVREPSKQTGPITPAEKEVNTEQDGNDERSMKDGASDIQVTVQNADTKKEQDGHHSFEQQGQNFAGDVIHQLSQAVSEVRETAASYLSNLEQQDIVRQVVEQIRIWNGSETSRMQVQLYPEHLGRVEVQVMLKNGTMTAQITAETEMAKAAIESQLQTLKESFQEKSIQVDAVEVSVGTPDFKHEQERQDSTKKESDTGTRGRRIRLNGFEDSGNEETEPEVNERLEAQGASVEFTA